MPLNELFVSVQERYPSRDYMTRWDFSEVSQQRSQQSVIFWLGVLEKIVIFSCYNDQNDNGCSKYTLIYLTTVIPNSNKYLASYRIQIKDTRP